MLWGTTYVLVRVGLEDLGPLMLAGIRYSLAGILLFPVLKMKKINICQYKKYFWQLAILGFLSFTLGNGLVGYALKYLPSTTVSLMSNLTAPFILVFGMLWLKETPRPIQFFGVFLALAGMAFYFYPQKFLGANPGYLIMFFGLLSFTAYALLARYLARSGEVPFLVQTTIPFLIGGGILLVLAIIFEGIPALTLKSTMIIIWMTLFNSIAGYILYNQAVSELAAIEVNIILKLSPFFTAFYAWILLGERITTSQLIAMFIVFAGIYLVQKGPTLFTKRRHSVPEQ